MADKTTLKVRRILKVIVLTLYVAFLIGVLWSVYNNRITLAVYFTQANYLFLLGFLITYVLGYLTGMIGWSMIIRSFDPRLNWWRNAKIYVVTLASRRLPGSVWYVGGRIAMYAELGTPKEKTLFASAVEYILFCLTGSILSLGMLTFSKLTLSPFVIALLIFVAVGGLVILHPKVLRLILRRYSDRLIGDLRYSNIIGWMLIYFIMWGLGGLMLSQFVGVFWSITFREALFITGSWTLVNVVSLLLIFIPASFGIADISVAVLLSQVMPSPLAGVITIMVRVLSIGLEVIFSLLALPVALNRKDHRQPGGGEL